MTTKIPEHLSNGNLILAHQSANTTVSFANTANVNVYFVRTQADGYLGTQTIIVQDDNG